MILSHGEQRGPPAPPAGVDAICDVFEAAWLAGQEPRIEDFLPRGDQVHQDVLLRELLLAEWDLRRRHAQHPELQTYHGRFPESRHSITDLWRVWKEKQSESVPNGPAIGSGTMRDGALLEEPGAVIDRYTLLEKLGEGGFGTVWVAEQLEPVRRRIALKLIKLGMDTQQVVARFEAERQALAFMDHANIAKVLDAGTTETGRPFFVMELVRGIPITKYCDQERLSTQGRLDLFMKICFAIQHAHQKGIIHRDIKPSNILVTSHDGVPVPKVIDFGIAKATQGELTDKTIYTHFAQFIGTPAYMSPEQAEMSGLDIDTRSDIYSLGVLLYELLTGATPFDAEDLMRSGLDEMRKTIREKEPLCPSSRLTQELQSAKSSDFNQSAIGNPHSAIDRDLDWIVMKCLEKDRTRRYETANSLAMDIQRHLDYEPIFARPPSKIYRFQKLVHRNKVTVIGGALTAAALLVASLVSGWQAVRATHAQREQNRLRQEAVFGLKREATLRNRAEKGEAAARRQAYAAEINVAFQSLAENNFARAVELLNRQRPRPGGEDLRGFEWRYLWHFCQSDEQASFPWGETPCMAFSPDGEVLAYSFEDENVTTVRDATSYKSVINLPSSALTLSFSSRDHLLAAAGSNSVVIWDTMTWQEVKSLPGATFAAQFSPDGRTLATASGAGVQLWNTETWEEAKDVLPGTPRLGWHARHELVFSPSGELLVTPYHDPVYVDDWFHVWKLPEREIVSGFKPFGAHIGSAAFLPDGKRLLTGMWDGALLVWNLATGEVAQTFKEHTAWITAIAVAPDGKTFATAGTDRTISVWDATTCKHLLTLRGHLHEIRSIAFSPDSRTIFSGSADGTVKSWYAGTHRGEQALDGASIVAGFAEDTRLLVAESRDGATLWNLQSNLSENIPMGGSEPFLYHRLAVHENEPLVALGKTNGSVDVWNLATRTSLSTWQAHSTETFAVAFSPSGKLLATASKGGEVAIWDWATQREAIRFGPLGDSVRCVAFSPDGTTLAGGAGEQNHNEHHNVWLWDVAGRRELARLQGHRNFVFAVAFSPDGTLLASASADNTARLWEVPSGKLRAILASHVQGVNAVAFSPDGKTLATGGTDSKVKLWNIATHQELATFPVEDSFRSLRFSPDGRDLAVGYQHDHGRGIRLWHAPSWEEIQAAESSRDCGKPKD